MKKFGVEKDMTYEGMVYRTLAERLETESVSEVFSGVADGTLDTIYTDATVVADALIFGGIAGNVISTQRATSTNCW